MGGNYDASVEVSEEESVIIFDQMSDLGNLEDDLEF